MDKLFYPHSIFSTSPNFTLSQIRDVSPGHGFQDLTEFAAGQVGPGFTGLSMASPDNRFTTTQLFTLFTATNAGEYGIARDLSAGNVDCEFKAGLPFGSRVAEATTQHLRLRMQSNAMICWESLSAVQGGIAEARCRLLAVLNGQTGNDPLVATSGVAVGNAGTITTLYTLGPVELNGTLMQGVQEADLTNNVQYAEEAGEGDGFITYCGLRSYAPVLTFRTKNLNVLATYGSRGTALSALTWFLRKKLASGINVPDATEEHIAITAATGTIKARQIAGDRPMAEVQVHLRQPSANTAAYAIDLASAIA